MQTFRFVFVSSLFATSTLSPARAGEVQINPLSQVITLLADLKAKVQNEGAKELSAYKKYAEWCDDFQKETENEIKEETTATEEDRAVIEESSSTIETASANIETFASDLSQAETELRKASQIREKEHADFVASEKELTDVLETLEKSMRALKKEANGGSASLAQVLASAGNLVSVLGLMADAASLNGVARQRLVSLAQARTQMGSDAMDEGSELGAPATAAYESKSSSIIEILEDLKEKTTAELSDLRQAEETAKHNFLMLQQSLKDEAGALNKQLRMEKSRKADASEEKATTEGELAETTKLLASTKASLEQTVSACKRTRADHEESVKSREEELEAIDEATKVLTDMTGGASEKTYSLLQLGSRSQLRTRSDLAHFEVVALLEHLAKAQNSAVLAQLAEQAESAISSGARTGKDAFVKVKALIRDLIEKLEAEASSEASEKAYCDEEMGKTSTKKDDLTEEFDKVTSRLEKAVSRVAQLKEDVTELQSQLSTIASNQAQIDKLREDSHTDYLVAKEDMEKGILGVRKALGVLRKYYAAKDKEAAAAALLQDGEDSSESDKTAAAPPQPTTHLKSSGAGSGIISMLEVCEADFSKNLEKVETEESDSLEDYEKVTEENKVTTAAKSTAVKAKEKEYKGLEVAITQHTSDRDNLDSELSALLEYEAKLKEKCIAKADSYAERKERRDEQIKGLRQAVKMLSTGASFAQRSARGRLHASLLAGHSSISDASEEALVGRDSAWA